ncbi:hypothetical protein E4V01_14010 [Methylorubrum sp. Q1]|uniref:hypothetical protein n=1 Tax=Methylorubrum sp. Q1 TaxID=2562453 RepID=UPI00107628F5|nr:hypothetical protein [Methylorubrum sp. Q1]TFZ57736.1 hypothetical protein E4V01_14010 [Methylorubrum sp. Q1]
MRALIWAAVVMGVSLPVQADGISFGPWRCADKPHPVCSHKSFNILIYGRVLCPAQAGATVQLGDTAYGFRTASGLLRFLAFPQRRLDLVADGEIFAVDTRRQDIAASEYLCSRSDSSIFGQVHVYEYGRFYVWTYSKVSRF